MKRPHILFILFPLIIPITIFLHIENETKSFIWSLLLIPNVFLIHLYPQWSIVFLSGLSMSTLKFITEGILHNGLPIDLLISLSQSSLVNWAIYLTVAFYLIKYKKALSHNERLTLIDDLTGIHNRRYFNDYAEKIIAFSNISNTKVVLCYLDIDYFKKVNDEHGHLCGDRALVHLTATVKPYIKETEAFARTGGEEFAIVLPGRNIQEAEVLIHDILVAIKNTPFFYDGKTIPLTASAGLAEYHQGMSKEVLFKAADNALYQAKKQGRNQYIIYSNRLDIPYSSMTEAH